MGAWHHSNIRSHVKEIEVTGAYDIRPETEQTVRAAHIRFYESLEQLLSDPQVDIVTIAVPNNFHKELSVAALRAGKHVICEKPVTMNAQELEEQGIKPGTVRLSIGTEHIEDIIDDLRQALEKI